MAAELREWHSFTFHAVVRTTLTLDAFLEWEERQELRYEFDGKQVGGVAGVTAMHAVIAMNSCLASTMRDRVGPCQPYGSDLIFRLPDVSAIPMPSLFVTSSRPTRVS